MQVIILDNKQCNHFDNTFQLFKYQYCSSRCSEVYWKEDID